MCRITKSHCCPNTTCIWQRARLVLIHFLWFVLKRLTRNTFHYTVFSFLYTVKHNTQRSRWRKAFLWAILFHQFMCQLDTVRLPPDNVHVGEKRKRVGESQTVSKKWEELRGLRLRDFTNHKKMGLSALEASLFSLRSIIFHRCCLDFKSLLPIYLLLPLLE